MWSLWVRLNVSDDLSVEVERLKDPEVRRALGRRASERIASLRIVDLERVHLVEFLALLAASNLQTWFAQVVGQVVGQVAGGEAREIVSQLIFWKNYKF